MADKIIITGSGKCGTTFFMELLTELGFYTGYEPGKVGDGEWKVAGKGAKLKGQPRILKKPYFCKNTVLLDTRDRWDWHIEHVYILLRKYDDVANNRVNRERVKSGLFPIEDEEEIRKDEKWRGWRKRASSNIGDLMFQLVSEDIPYTFLMFPRIITDPEYLWSNCKILQTLDYETFRAGFDKVADLDKVHWGLE